MSSSDTQLRIGVLIAGAVLVAVITYMRFCGSVSLPDKPPPPTGPSGTARQLLEKTASTPSVYAQYLESDAAIAGTRAPTIDQMSRKLPYHVDEPNPGIPLEPGQKPIERAGLRLHLERSGDSVVLVVQNLLDSEIAYNVQTTPSLGGSLCAQSRPLPFNAMVIAKRGTETRTECAWRDGLAIIITKIETVELSHLQAWYLNNVPPQLVGIDDRIARGHRATSSKEGCTAVVSAAVRSGMDRGDIGWRDLVDFYARHRCQTYQFPATYRAFKSDGERALPALD
jgi:hypothetical protein